MAFLDMDMYRQACQRAAPDVDSATLMEAIHRVYRMWLEDKRMGRPYIFHQYFGWSMESLGVTDMFEQERYRKALGAYFNPRALKRLAELRAMKPNPVNSSPVELATATRVRLRVCDAVSIEFGTISKRRNKLKWNEVQEEFDVIHLRSCTEDIDSVRHQARVQALAIMNSRRK